MNPLFPLLASSYHSHGIPQYALFLGALVIVALAIAGFYFWNNLRKAREQGIELSPEDLFSELCEIHALNRPERALLSQIARNRHVSQPASLFIDPRLLDQGARTDDADAPRYKALLEKLFGTAD